MLHRMSPFYLTTLSFLGFSKDEQRHMEEVTVENGELIFQLLDDVTQSASFQDNCTQFHQVQCWLHFSVLIVEIRG